MELKKKQILKMTDEILRYFLEKKANNINFNINELEDKFIIKVSSFLDITEEEIEDINSKFVKHRDKEYEIYWELMGSDSEDDELELLFILATDIIIYYEDDKFTVVIELDKK